MTDRVHSFLVVLEKDLREDDAESTLNAIATIRGVLRIVPARSGLDLYMAETAATQRARAKLIEVATKFE